MIDVSRILASLRTATTKTDDPSLPDGSSLIRPDKTKHANIPEALPNTLANLRPESTASDPVEAARDLVPIMAFNSCRSANLEPHEDGPLEDRAMMALVITCIAVPLARGLGESTSTPELIKESLQRSWPCPPGDPEARRDAWNRANAFFQKHAAAHNDNAKALEALANLSVVAVTTGDLGYVEALSGIIRDLKRVGAP